MYYSLRTISFKTDVNTGVIGGNNGIEQANKGKTYVSPAGPIKTCFKPDIRIIGYCPDQRVVGPLVNYIDKMAGCGSPSAKAKYIELNTMETIDAR
ncbi:hypothetical protein D3C79_614440 [compost metagenome]